MPRGRCVSSGHASFVEPNTDCFMMFSLAFAWLSTVLSALVVTTYTVSFCIRYGIPTFISASYYKLKHPILFTLSMWATGGLAIPGILVGSDLHTKGFGFVAVAGLFLVGAAPRFKDKHQLPIHIVGTSLAIIGSTGWVGFNRPEVLVLWSFLVLYGLCLLVFWKRIKPKPLFVAEVIALAAFYAAIFLRLFCLGK